MGDNLIKLDLSQDEVNQVLFALADKPYKEVFELIAKIRGQAQKQINP